LNFSGVLRRAGVPDAHAGYFNTGLASAAHGDRGLAEVTRRARDTGRFRVPTLRNVALTAPYMHDGSLPTLAAVLDHYVGIGANARRRGDRIDARLKVLTLSTEQRADLLAFLESLTDPDFGKAAVACARPH
jgi:cytochrome c peroxidase